VAGELRVVLEAADRPDLGEQLCAGKRTATEQLEQRQRELGYALF
jgi:hypothetical protein